MHPRLRLRLFRLILVERQRSPTQCNRPMILAPRSAQKPTASPDARGSGAYSPSSNYTLPPRPGYAGNASFLKFKRDLLSALSAVG